jgi:acyl-CoA carboxylase epsilon subunit
MNEAEPVIRVVRGNPNDEELVAVLTVLAAAAQPPTKPAQPKPSDNGWAAYWRSVGTPLRPGPGVWRASAWDGSSI